MRIPDSWHFALLALGAFRIVRIIGWDTITSPVRVRLFAYTDEGRALWHVPVGERLHGYRVTAGMQRRGKRVAEALENGHGGGFWGYASKLIRCPWCQGWWVCLIVAIAYWQWPHATLCVCVPLALSSAVGLVAKHLDA